MFAWWLDVPDVAALAKLREEVEKFSATVPRFAGFNIVAAQKATKFDEEARKSISEIRSRFREKQLAIATVIEGDGFWAAAVRAVASGMAMIANEPFPSKNFDSAGDAVAWLASVAKLDATGLAEAVKRFTAP